MLDLLEKIINSESNSKTKQIQENESLLEWVNNNCSKDLLDPSCPNEQLLKRKIWSCLFPNEEVKCCCGKWLKFKNYKKKLGYCSKSCKYAKELKASNFKKALLIKYGVTNPSQILVSKEKRKLTNIKKYGVENPTQNAKIQLKIKKTNLQRYGNENLFKTENFKKKARKSYQLKYGVTNPSRSAIIQEKKKATTFKNYGVMFPSQSDLIKNKQKETCLTKYGTSSFPQSHISQDNLKILNNSELLSNFLIQNGFKKSAILLGISLSHLYKYHKKHNLNLFSSSKSCYEIEISDWLKQYNINYLKNVRTIIPFKELDFYFPEHKMAIEFNGLYWHSENNKKEKNYHINKTNQAQQLDINLLQIFEDEWLNKKDICKNVIKSYLNLVSNKIMARKCKVIEINNKQSQRFLEENHLQGYTSASLNLGLFFNEELLEIMTFRRPRYNKKIEWEILRLATKLDTQVLGGTQKLWSYFIKTSNPTSVVSYCDRRWFTGKIYKNLNFIKSENVNPTYWYTDYEKRYHRSKFTKKNAIKIAKEKLDSLENNLEQLSEKIIMTKILGYDRIWDCGQDTWTWTIK